MSYEVLIATGRDDGADADKPLKMALVYRDGNGNKKISDYLKPGEFSNRDNAYENGQMDICSPINFTANGSNIDTDDFIGVMVAFTDKDWQLDTIWVTNRSTGKYLWKHVDKMFGNNPEVGTEKHPYEVLLDGPVTVDPAAQQNQNDFTLEVSTQSGDYDYGTNDNVFFKLFDNTGHASQITRKEQWGNQYQAGSNNTLAGFDTLYGQLSKDIVTVMIVKVGNDGWRPKSIIASPSLLSGHKSTFDIVDHMPPGEMSLDTHHNWTTAPSKESTSGRSAAKEPALEET